ncbi:uncharacterized protein VP01_1476g3 [Puccinia sorghi]|uniref:Uncharacterized protein n=1 Tax=Puccinia sorghi TaxID=27349 RepID=A0A0L6VLH1_9BASI|nr:uncharacterized protein VP01_1476g3 [Puccinia sorghi]
MLKYFNNIIRISSPSEFKESFLSLSKSRNFKKSGSSSRKITRFSRLQYIANQAQREFFGVDRNLLEDNNLEIIPRGFNTFLLAGTGFGKSWILQMYHILLPQIDKGVVLVLNLLDTVVFSPHVFLK